MGGSFSICRLVALALFVLFPALSQDDLVKLYAEAQQAQAAGDLATASRKYEAIVRLRPQMAEAYANLGNLYYQQGQMERAKAAYQKAIGIKPELAAPYFFLGVIAFGGHDYSSALRDLQRAEKLQGANVLIHSYLGYTQYARSSFREAAEEFEKAVALDATDIDVLYHLCKSYGHLAQGFVRHTAEAVPEFGLYQPGTCPSLRNQGGLESRRRTIPSCARKAAGQCATAEKIGVDGGQGHRKLIRGGYRCGR